MGNRSKNPRVFAFNNSLVTAKKSTVAPKAFLNSPPSRAPSLVRAASINSLFPDQPMHKITLCEAKEYRKKGQIGKISTFFFNGKGKHSKHPAFIRQLGKEIKSQEESLGFDWGVIQVEIDNQVDSYSMDEWLDMEVSSSCRCC